MTSRIIETPLQWILDRANLEKSSLYQISSLYREVSRYSKDFQPFFTKIHDIVDLKLHYIKYYCLSLLVKRIFSWFMRYLNLFDHLFFTLNIKAFMCGFKSKNLLVSDYFNLKELDDFFFEGKTKVTLAKSLKVRWSNKLKNLMNQENTVFRTSLH